MHDMFYKLQGVLLKNPTLTNKQVFESYISRFCFKLVSREYKTWLRSKYVTFNLQNVKYISVTVISSIFL